MTLEKASTLKLLRKGIGNPISVVEDTGSALFHTVRARVPTSPGATGSHEETVIPVLFLLTSLAFLEAMPVAKPSSDAEETSEEEGGYSEVDGWLPADFLSHLRFEENQLRICLGEIRGRMVATEIVLNSAGELTITTQGRGQSATRWISYVRGQSHLQPAQ